MLMMLRLDDADDLEKILQECENMKVREAYASMESSKFRQRVTSQAAQVPAKPSRAVRAIHVKRESSGSDMNSCGSDSDSDQRKVYMATSADRAQKPEDPLIRSAKFDQYRHCDRVKSQTACTHFGSKRRGNRGCWKRLTCQKCVRKDHPASKCYNVCYVCKNVHEKGKSFGETVLQHDPSVICSYQACRDVSGTSREDAKLRRSPGWNLVRAKRSRLSVYAFVERKLVDGSCDQQYDLNNTCDSSNVLRSVSSVKRPDTCTLLRAKMELVLAPGESKGCWKYYTP